MKCARLSYRTSFISMFILTVVLFSCKIVVGYMSNSMALIADSFHMLSDLAVLAVGYSALHFATRKSPNEILDSAYTFGRVRAEILGGLINAIFLVAFCFSITVEAFKRFVVAEHVAKPFPVLVVGVTSLLVNLIGLIIFHQRRRRKSKFSCRSQSSLEILKQSLKRTEVSDAEDHHLSEDGKGSRGTNTPDNISWTEGVSKPREMNREGVYLHILEHVLSSFIIVLSSLIVMFVNQSWTSYVDPVITILVVIIVLYSTFPLMKEAIMIFMQSVPADLKTDELEKKLLEEIPSVLGVHEFHIWQLAGEHVIASAHILLDSNMDFSEVSKLVKDFFHDEGIYHVTLQPEFLSVSAESISDGTDECLLLCAENQTCKDFTCCVKDAVPIVQSED